MQISIIVLSYNRKDLLEKCLSAIFRYLPESTEVIVVDNGSTENIPDFVRTNYQKATLISLKNNTGFANGNNIGMQRSKGEYLVLVNSDAFLEANVIESLVNFMENHPDAGAVGPQILNSDRTIQPSGGFFPSLFQIFLLMTFIDSLPIICRFAPSIHIRNKSYFTKIRQMEWITGAFLLIRREVFEKTGGFDQNIFMYGEELEWQYRMHKMGYKSYCLPTVKVIHLGFSSSSPANGATKELQSFVAFFRKYKPVWQIPILKLLIIFGCLLRICRGLIQSKHHWMIKAYLNGIIKMFYSSDFNTPAV